MIVDPKTSATELVQGTRRNRGYAEYKHPLAQIWFVDEEKPVGEVKDYLKEIMIRRENSNEEIARNDAVSHSAYEMFHLGMVNYINQAIENNPARKSKYLAFRKEFESEYKPNDLLAPRDAKASLENSLKGSTKHVAETFIEVYDRFVKGVEGEDEISGEKTHFKFDREDKKIFKDAIKHAKGIVKSEGMKFLGGDTTGEFEGKAQLFGVPNLPFEKMINLFYKKYPEGSLANRKISASAVSAPVITFVKATDAAARTQAEVSQEPFVIVREGVMRKSRFVKDLERAFNQGGLPSSMAKSYAKGLADIMPLGSKALDND